MTYEHLIDSCFTEAIGAGGVERADYDAMLGHTAVALDVLRAAHDDGRLPLLGLPATRADLNELRPVADRFRAEFDDGG